MRQAHEMSAESVNPAEEERRAAIHAAAIVAFSERGFAATSMAHIADSAGMSRPALYQYFRNKGDIFASAFTALVDEAADRSLASLREPGSREHQIDGFLQRFDGDLWERTSASPHGAELLSAKSEYAPSAMRAAVDRLQRGLAAYLKHIDGGARSASAARRRMGWMEILEFSPKGFKFDQPSVAVYRRRLTSLARSVASDIDAR